MIDVKNGTLTLNIGDEKVGFQIERAMKYPSSVETCFRIDVIEECLEGLANEYLLEHVHHSMRHDLDLWSEKHVEESEVEAICAAEATSDAHDDFLHGPHTCDTGRVSPGSGRELGPDETDPTAPHGSCSIDTDRAEAQTEPTPELKPLPVSLRYEFLGPNNSYPVIVNADLNPEQTAKLLEKLKIHKGAIGYSIKDLKGINPNICSHRILLEDDHKPSVQHQRRLNPNLKEVVKKEILKLLDAGIIYPISDSKWVSPIHVVPKKGGTTAVKNDKNELIQTRVVTGWRMCVDYRKLNTATRKDHFPLTFVDQLLERLANQWYCCAFVTFIIGKSKKGRKSDNLDMPHGPYNIVHGPCPTLLDRLIRALHDPDKRHRHTVRTEPYTDRVGYSRL